MRQVLLNIVIAFLWVLFQDEDSFKLSTFFAGYLIGILVIYILHRFFGQQFYLKKVWVGIKILVVYLYQLITSSMTIINYILFIHAIDVSDKEKQKLLKSIRQYEGLILEVAE